MLQDILISCYITHTLTHTHLCVLVVQTHISIPFFVANTNTRVCTTFESSGGHTVIHPKIIQ